MKPDTKNKLLLFTYFLGGCIIIAGINQVPYLPSFVMGGIWGGYLLNKTKGR